MVDESKSIKAVSTKSDDSEVTAATMNQRNVPWDQNSRPNSSLRQLLPRELLDDDIHDRQAQLLPPHPLDHSTDFADLLATTLSSDCQETPSAFQPPQRRRLNESDKLQRPPHSHQEKRPRWLEPSSSPPSPSPHYHDNDAFVTTSDDEDAKQPYAQHPQQEYRLLPDGDLYFPPPPPPPQHDYHSYYSYPNIPRYSHVPHDPYYGYPQPRSVHYTFGEVPGATSHHYQHHGPATTAPPKVQASQFPVPSFAAPAGESSSQIPTGPTEAERREAGNNRAEQALEKWYALAEIHLS